MLRRFVLRASCEKNDIVKYAGPHTSASGFAVRVRL